MASAAHAPAGRPMAGVVEGFRWALLGNGTAPGLVAISVAVTLVLLPVGALYFGRMERTLADVF